MNIRTPQPRHAARILVSHMNALGLSFTYAQALEAVARMHGYASWQTMSADPSFTDELAVKAVSSNELELKKNHDSVWVGVDSISAAITRTDEGVVVDLYAKGQEEEGALTSTYLYFHEAEAQNEEESEGTREGEAPADWKAIADNDTLSRVRINGDKVGVLYFINREAAFGTSPEGEARAQVGFAYFLPESPDQSVDFTLGTLEGATQNSEGLITLQDGRTLEFLTEATVLAAPADIFDDVTAGLREYYPALRDSRIVQHLRDKHLPRGSCVTHSQLAYEQLRDVIEKEVGSLSWEQLPEEIRTEWSASLEHAHPAEMMEAWLESLN